MAALALGSCSTGPDLAAGETATQLHLVSREHMSMGAPVQLSAYTTREADAVTAFDAAFAEFDRLDSLLSVWKEGSDVLRMNASAGERPVSVSTDTLDVLRQAVQAGDWTNGKFDITFGALADVWKFDHDQDNRIPTPSEIAARLPLVDYRQVVIDEKARTAFIRRPGARVHLGGIGKGFAVDHVVAILRSRGLTDFMVQSGGDLYVAGRRGDRPWRLGIRDPRGPADRTFATLELSDSTFSTSGDYERFFMQNGVRYHHLIDPDRRPAGAGDAQRHDRREAATLADWLSTGVFVSGPEAGHGADREAARRGRRDRDGPQQVLVSSGLKGQLNLSSTTPDLTRRLRGVHARLPTAAGSHHAAARGRTIATVPWPAGRGARSDASAPSLSVCALLAGPAAGRHAGGPEHRTRAADRCRPSGADRPSRWTDSSTAGADANAVDADGTPALMAATLFADAKTGRAPASPAGRSEPARRLRCHGADVGRAGPGEDACPDRARAPT